MGWITIYNNASQTSSVDTSMWKPLHLVPRIYILLIRVILFLIFSLSLFSCHSQCVDNIGTARAEWFRSSIHPYRRHDTKIVLRREAVRELRSTRPCSNLPTFSRMSRACIQMASHAKTKCSQHNNMAFHARRVIATRTGYIMESIRYSLFGLYFTFLLPFDISSEMSYIPECCATIYD